MMELGGSGRPFVDLSGQTFGRLFVKNRIEDQRVKFECVCVCGKTKFVESCNLTRKSGTVSCGCWRESKKLPPGEKDARDRVAKRRWAKNNPARMKAIKATFYQRHKDDQCLRSALYRLANPELIRLSMKVYREKNKNRILERERLPAVRKKRREASLLLRRTDPAKAYASKRRRRARIYLAEGEFTAQDIRDIREAQRNKCAMPWCKKSLRHGFHIDHIMPLALGGSNARRNIQLLCRTCNLRKGFKHPVIFVAENGMLI